MKTCYYKILGIPIRATEEEIKRAFRLLAMRWHPDRNPDDPRAAERFREVLSAYETLVDPTTRWRYDCARGYEKSKKKKGPKRSDHQDGDGEASFEDVFQEFFGIDHRIERSNRGIDLRFDLQLPKSAIVAGMFEEIDYSRVVFCLDCIGRGRKRPLRSCERCKGKGELEEACKVRVWIPPGSLEGTRLRVQGGGDCLSPGGQPGDLIVLLHVIEGQ